MISPVGLIDFAGVRVTPGQTEFRDWPYYATRIITSSLQFDNLQLSCKKWHSLSYYYAIKDGIPLVRTCQPYLKLYQKRYITKITKMQASIKGYFSKNGYTLKAAKSSTSAVVSSPAPVKLVSYRTPNSPSRPLKRKAAEDLVTENKNDYELKRCRRYQPHWKCVFSWLQYDAVTNKFEEGTNLFKIFSVKNHESSIYMYIYIYIYYIYIYIYYIYIIYIYIYYIYYIYITNIYIYLYICIIYIYIIYII